MPDILRRGKPYLFDISRFYLSSSIGGARSGKYLTSPSYFVLLSGRDGAEVVRGLSWKRKALEARGVKRFRSRSEPNYQSLILQRISGIKMGVL